MLPQSTPQASSKASLKASGPQSPSGETRHADPWSDEVQQEVFKPLTPEEALQWKARQPVQSVWQVVWWQLMLAAAVTLVALLVTRQVSVVWSVAYGALCVLLPTALMVYGVSSRALSRWFRLARPAGAGAALASLFFWEGIKILLAVVLMGLAPLLIVDLSWLGLLAGLVVVLKAYWLAFVLGRRKPA